MAIREFEVEVTQTVKITIDDEKLNDEFNEVFSSYMWDVDCVEDHAQHLAQMKARGMIGMDQHVEGYGDLRKQNCSAQVLDQTNIEITKG